MPYALRPKIIIKKILNFQNLKLILNCIIHYLFYVTAFSATFNLFNTKLIYLATFLYQHVKERREKSSATAKVRHIIKICPVRCRVLPRVRPPHKLAISRFRRQRYEEKMKVIGR